MEQHETGDVYFVFGSEICKITAYYNDEDIKKEVDKNTSFGTYHWNEESTPQELASAAEGWDGWDEVSKDLYDYLTNL